MKCDVTINKVANMEAMHSKQNLQDKKTWKQRKR